MSVKEYTPAQTLLKIIIEGLNKKESIEESLQRCNEWQRERMAAEREVFGREITRELTEQEVRNARVYIIQNYKKGAK